MGYHTLPSTPDDLAQRLPRIDELSPFERRVLLVRVANQLEETFDRGRQWYVFNKYPG